MSTMLFHWYNSLHAVKVVLICLSVLIKLCLDSGLTTVKILLDMAQFYSDIVDDQLLSAALYRGYLIVNCTSCGYEGLK